jgi:CubicO group peptidase (beta-lactamase class C family)
VAEFYVALAHGRLVDPALIEELTRGRGVEPELVIGGDREWGLGVALDPDGYGMGGVGGSFGWWSEAGQYAVAFLTGHIGDHDRGDQLESVVRDVLGLPRL